MSGGKNFSRNRKRIDRVGADLYQTPYGLTREFITAHVQREWFKPGSYTGDIADLCDGHGAITKILREAGYENVIGKDLLTGDDFLLNQEHYDYGIMNPPFRLFNEWVLQSFRTFKKGFALLAPTTYLQGVGRYNEYGDGVFQRYAYPLRWIYTYNRYPMLSAELREDGKFETGMQALSWFVFQFTGNSLAMQNPPTEHRWIDVDKWVVRVRGKKYGI